MIVYVAADTERDAEYFEMASMVARWLIRRGMSPLLPVPATEEVPRQARLRMAMAEIDAAEAVYMLPGWGESAAMRILAAYTAFVGKKVYEMKTGEDGQPEEQALPCPVCGGSAEIVEVGYYMIAECADCGFKFSHLIESDDEVED